MSIVEPYEEEYNRARRIALEALRQTTPDFDLLSPRSQEYYVYITAKLVMYAWFNRKEFTELSEAEIVDFLKQYKANSRVTVWNVIRRFYPPSYRIRVKSMVYMPKALNSKQLKKLYECVKDEPHLRTVFLTLLYTGMRRRELVSLTLDDIDLELGHIKVKGKGGKVRYIPIVKQLRPVLEEWINTYRPMYVERSFKLFESWGKQGQRLIELYRDRVFPYTPKTINEWFYRMEVCAGFHVTPHMLRHTFATRLIMRGVPINVVQALLGHSSIETTARYIMIAQPDRDEVSSALDGVLE